MTFGPVFELSSLDGLNGFKLSGEAAYDDSGRSVASAGDVNGDGFADVIVGAPGAGSKGTSYVAFGQAGGFAANLDLSTLDGTNGFRISGELRGDQSGRSVASAGDVNGDGFADLIIGAPFADPHGSLSGASYVVFGHAGGFRANLKLSTLDSANGFEISGEAERGFSGYSAASAGDVNGDGFADLIIGAPFADSHGEHSGASYVVFGRSDGFAADLDLSTLDGVNGFQISGEVGFEYNGWSVASAGDVNDDGFADLIIGAPGDGLGYSPNASYVVFGRAGGFAANLDLSSLDGSNGFKISSETAFDNSGRSVAAAGDVNGDGFADLIVGAPRVISGGASYVVFGRAGGFGGNLNLSRLNGTNGFQISGEAEDDYSGTSVASAGDVNGDGFADLIVGAFGADPHGSLSGASYVVFGKVSGFAATLDLSSLDGNTGFQINGEAENDAIGISVASANDVNGDGFDDLIVGAPGADPHGSGSGSSYVIFGRATGPITRVGTAADEFFVGGDFRDSLEGRGGDDTLLGNGGNDHRLLGGGGDDVIDGGAGRDFLTGGEGQDTLTGGADADRFVFTGIADSPADSRPDVIADFEPGLDRISFKAIDADPGLVGDQAFVFLGSDGFTGAGGEVRYRQAGGDTIVAGDVDGDGAADFQVRLAGLIDLTAGDFIL